MDPEHRRAIKASEEHLKRIDKRKLRPFIEKSKLFTRSMLKDIFDNEEACLIEELPTRGPNAFNVFLEVLKDAGEYEAAENLEKSVCRTQISNSSNINIKPPYYKMSPSTIGYCLIVNNVDFKEQFEQRNWSDEDTELLYHVFSKIGYKVKIKNNLGERDIYLALEDIAVKGDLDSCVVIILSYGGLKDNHEIIYGSDEKFLYVFEILKLFGSTKSKLHDKLKLFFLPTNQPSANNIKTQNKDSSSDSDSNVPYKDTFVYYFPAEKIDGISFMNAFSKILLDNYKTQDFDSMLRQAMATCSSFKMKPLKYGIKAGIHFYQET